MSFFYFYNQYLCSSKITFDFIFFKISSFKLQIQKTSLLNSSYLKVFL